MFEEYFVLPPIARALRECGFNEPCIGAYEINAWGCESKLIISYTNQRIDPNEFDEATKELFIKRPGLFRDLRKNSELPQWLYAAPLYDQVKNWLFTKNLRIHETYIAKTVFKKGDNGAWFYSVYDTIEGNCLWPPVIIHSQIDGFYEDTIRKDAKRSTRIALEEAILKAINILKNET